MSSLVDDILDLLGSIVFLGVCVAIAFGVVVPLMYQPPASTFSSNQTAIVYQGASQGSTYTGTLSKLGVILVSQIQDYNMPNPKQYVVSSTTGGSPVDVNVGQVGPNYDTSYNLSQYGSQIALALQGDTSSNTQYRVGYVPSSTPSANDGYYTISPKNGTIDNSGVPTITEVSWGTSTWSPSMTISGVNFGQFGSLVIYDPTQGGWESTSTSGVPYKLGTVNSTTINVSSFSGYGSGDDTYWTDGMGSWSFRPGDTIDITYQNNLGQSAHFQTQYPSAPMPSVTLNPVSNLTSGTTTSITGTVTFNGQPLANQAVVLTTTAGSFTPSGGYVRDNNSKYMVWTNSAGQFIANYTAPSYGTSVTVTASSAGQQQSTSFTTSSTSNAIILFPQGMSLGTISTSGGSSWNTFNLNQASNGTPLIFQTSVSTTGTVLNFNVSVDDTATVYVDGTPEYLVFIGQNGTFSVNVTPGEHVIQVFAENDGGQNPVSNSTPNPARLYVEITGSSGNVLASTSTKPYLWSVLQPSQGASYFEPYIFQGTDMGDGSWNTGASFYSNSGVPTGPAEMPGQYTVNVGASSVLTGQLLSNGEPLPNVPVTVNVSDGLLSQASTGGSSVDGSATKFTTTTNSQGVWTVNFTAPNQSEYVNTKISGDGASENTNINVVTG